MATPDKPEIISLDQSIAYATSLAQTAGEHGPVGNEGYIAGLVERKVTGQALRTAHEMQEAWGNAAEAAARHAAELKKQTTVQEAYDQAPDTGDKTYLQQGR